MSRIKNHRWFRFITNKYLASFLIFGVWMLFFDTHSYLIHRTLNNELDDMQKDISFYETELSSMRVELYELVSNPDAFEKYAREKFWMHKKGEHIVLIEYNED